MGVDKAAAVRCDESHKDASMIAVLLGSALFLLVVIIALQVFMLCRKTAVDLAPLQTALDSTDRVGQRTESAVREEISRNREEASKAAQLERQEVAANLKGVGDSLYQQLTSMRETVEKRLEVIQDESAKGLEKAHEVSATGVQKTREEVTTSLKSFQDGLNDTIGDFVNWQRTQFGSVLDQLKGLTDLNEKRLTEVRTTVEQNLQRLQEDNNKNLEQMRQTVDEKLQGTLEKRLGESFKLVSERLEQVHKGLGEMQALATGVGDLKRVLTNVRARGTWGEVQLDRMLEQVFSPSDYDKNVATKDGGERVEFAIRLPGRGDVESEVVWLPIDAKFPIEDYQRLQEAQENGDAELVECAAKGLENRIKCCAGDITGKYLNPPKTTDFCILFLPTEGLFAEVLRRPGLAEILQRDFKVVVAGPTTLWALLNSLQMGFRTLAIQKRSSEVWSLLGAVKTEFGKYGDILDKVKKKLTEAQNTVDDAGRRTRAIERKLRDVQELPAADVQPILSLEHMENDPQPEADVA
jgi:DNA recombination protein RmuC